MKTLEPYAIALLAVFAPIKVVALVALTLIAVDLIVGLTAAIKRGDKITSAGLRRTITKVFVYETAILMAFLVQKYMTGDAIPASNLVSGLIGVVEAKSILESLDELNGSPIFKTLIVKLGSRNDNL